MDGFTGIPEEPIARLIITFLVVFLHEYKNKGIVTAMSQHKTFNIFAFVTSPLVVCQLLFTDIVLPIDSIEYLKKNSSSISDKVDIRIYNVDDFATLYVNGIKFINTKFSTDTGRIKLDKYLVNGQNTLRFVTQNNGGKEPSNPMSYGYQVWVNDKIVLNEKCGQIGVGGCNNNQSFSGSKVHEKLINININNLISKSHIVNIISAVQGRIYLNGEYTGKNTPSSLTLPTGSYYIGLGGVNDRYQEILSQISSNQTLKFTDANWFQAKPWKILLLSIRKAHLGYGKGGNQTARLTDTDIKTAYGDLLEVSKRWVEPFSYGLVKWDVSQLVIENVTAAITDEGDHINQNLFTQAAGLTNLQDRYDTVVFFWPRVPDKVDPWNQAGAVGGGSSVSIPNTWLRWGLKFPREVWLHEWLHVAEGVNSRHSFFGGMDGLHGAEKHGYPGGVEGEWLHWYRDFMRGAVKEDGLFVGIPPHSWLLGSRLDN
jgi:hypothetical protein